MNSIKVNKSFLTTVATLFVGIVSTVYYLKFHSSEECKKSEEDELFEDEKLEGCDQSAFDGSERDYVENEICLSEENNDLDKQIITDEMKTSQEWYNNDNNVCIRDPDGWRDNKDPKKFWENTPISKENYIIRRNLSTLSFTSDKNDPFHEDNIDDLI